MNKIIQEDVDIFASQFELAEQLQGSTFLITGATGLIGSSLIRCLLALKKQIKIIAPVRSISKIDQIFEENQIKEIEFINCDFINYNYSNIGKIDYIVHCAAPTSSKFFVERPVETFNTIMKGTQRMLDLANEKKIKSMVYLSSLEVYGEIQDDTKTINEEIQGYLNPTAVRASYPMAKRASENICCLYAAEYNTSVKIARLTQTTGAGIAKDDNRIIAQFAKNAAQGDDIVLHTTGDAARPYCYVTDSVSAILYILLKGIKGECYNVANETTYISAKNMALFVRDNFNPNIHVKIEINENMGYAPATKQKLSTHKIQQLGWIPKHGLKEIFDRLIKYLKDS